MPDLIHIPGQLGTKHGVKLAYGMALVLCLFVLKWLGFFEGMSDLFRSWRILMCG